MRNAYVIAVSLAALALAGCFSEEVLMRLDLVAGQGRIDYLNLASFSNSPEGVEVDFSALVKAFYHTRPFEGESDYLLSQRARLYEADGKLHGTVTFTFVDIVRTLEYFDIERAPGGRGGQYLTRLGSDMDFGGGNGIFTEDASGRVVRWPADEKVIELRMRLAKWDTEPHTSFLPHWLKWREAGGEARVKEKAATKKEAAEYPRD